jgi:hypothetical protein
VHWKKFHVQPAIVFVIYLLFYSGELQFNDERNNIHISSLKAWSGLLPIICLFFFRWPQCCTVCGFMHGLRHSFYSLFISVIGSQAYMHPYNFFCKYINCIFHYICLQILQSTTFRTLCTNGVTHATLLRHKKASIRITSLISAFLCIHMNSLTVSSC